MFSMASPRKRHKFAHKFGQNRRASLTEIGRAITIEIWAISNRNYSGVNFDQSFYINQICLAWYSVLYRGFIEATEVWVKTIRSHCFPCRGRKYDQFGIHKFSNKIKLNYFAFLSLRVTFVFFLGFRNPLWKLEEESICFSGVSVWVSKQTEQSFLATSKSQRMCVTKKLSRFTSRS